MFAEVPADFKSTAPSWEDLGALLASQQTEQERSAAAQAEAGRGPTNARATLRLFDAPDGYAPRVTLWRDSASWCPYCELVWLQLEEKRVPYRVEFVNMRCYGSKPASFLALNPSGGIPLARIDGRVMKESRDILAAIEETFPENVPLAPGAGAGALLRLERDLFSCWFQWLTSGARSDGYLRQTYCELLDRVEQALVDSGGPYFMGADLTMVDIMYTPFLERMSASLPYYKGLVIRGGGAARARWPALQRWYGAMEARPTYARMRNDYYSHAHNLPPQIGGCVTVLPADGSSAHYAAEIDGTDGEAWRLPLRGGGVEGGQGDGEGDTGAARREAAAAMLRNHGAVVRFACRGAGTPGIPGVGAPLADPNAGPNLKFEGPVDAALRHVVQALLTSPSSAQEGGLTGGQPKEPVAACLGYLRDRVGVPRDMGFPAARQLRAHINWYLDTLAST